MNTFAVDRVYLFNKFDVRATGMFIEIGEKMNDSDISYGDAYGRSYCGIMIVYFGRINVVEALKKHETISDFIIDNLDIIITIPIS